MKPGPQNAITDIAGLRVGNAEDHAIKTGTTVLLPDAPLTASVHVMGGAPGTRETDLLAPDKTVDQVHALVLSGGSAFGLDAASGVADALRAQGRGFAVLPGHDHHRYYMLQELSLALSHYLYRGNNQLPCQTLFPFQHRKLHP